MKIKLKIDILIMSVIILSPFLFFLHNLVPKYEVWSTSWFVINSGFYDDVNYFFWLISSKLLTLFVLVIWFCTNSKKWKYVLLIPIIIEIDKVYSIYKSLALNKDYIPELGESLYYSIPFVLILLFLTHLGNKLILSKSNNDFLNNEIINEMVKLSKFDNRNYSEVKKELKKLRSKKELMKNREYLAKLIEMRDRLSI